MPLGKLAGTKTIKKKKQKPEPKPEPHIEPQPTPKPPKPEPKPKPPEPEPIPKPEPPKPPKPEPVLKPEPPKPPKPEPVPKPEPPINPAPTYIADLHIVMAGRTLGIQREYLASMRENLTQMLSAEGLTFYIRDLQTITDIVDVSKRLGDFFFRFSRENWTYPADDAVQAEYEFSISPAGSQNGAVHFGVHCVTPDAGSVNLRQADAVWCLADGPMWGEETVQDEYPSWLRSLLSSAVPLSESVPVVLIQAQAEALTRFQKQGTKQTLPAAGRRKLEETCRTLLGGGADRDGAHQHHAAMIPVQLYDGLEYSGKDANGIPYLRLSADGYHQMYMPVNCQMPVLYTLQIIARTRNIHLFEETVRGGFPAAAERHYQQKTGKKDWVPSELADAANGKHVN